MGQLINMEARRLVRNACRLKPGQWEPKAWRVCWASAWCCIGLSYSLDRSAEVCR